MVVWILDYSVEKWVVSIYQEDVGMLRVCGGCRTVVPRARKSGVRRQYLVTPPPVVALFMLWEGELNVVDVRGGDL